MIPTARNIAFSLILIQILIMKQAFCENENVNDNRDKLVSVVVVYRHGDRAPLQTYPKDPYNDPSYWPMGYGQLTNIGKMQQYELGQWLRKRYGDFLSDEFSNKELHVRSTNVDRTLMSAECNLAGLFPPINNQIWNLKLKWQPIPIHTIPESMDNLLSMKQPCEKYKELRRALFTSQEFIDINKKNHELYGYLTRNSGSAINSLETLQTLYNTLFIENLYNLTLPNWTKSVFPDKLKPWGAFSFATSTYTQEMTRLRTGPFFDEILNNFLNATQKIGPKMYMYSAHDTTIADILHSLNLFEYHSPPYAATVVFELRSRHDIFYLNIFYKNTSIAREMILKDCEFNCPLTKFNAIVEPIRITKEEWEFECQAKFLGVLPFDTLQTSVFAGCMGLLLILICSLIVSVFFSRKRRVSNNYLRLPVQDCND